jgi:hypothetical protein
VRARVHCALSVRALSWPSRISNNSEITSAFFLPPLTPLLLGSARPRLRVLVGKADVLFLDFEMALFELV